MIYKGDERELRERISPLDLRRAFAARSLGLARNTLGGRPGGIGGGGAAPLPTLDLFDTGIGTFTRASEGSYLTGAPTDGSSAFLAWAPANVRRIENRGDGAFASDGGDALLMDGARTNRLLWSEDLTNAAWVKSLCSISATNGNAPDGEADADTIAFTADATAQVSQTITGTSDGWRCTVSVWLRAATAQSVRLTMLLRDGTEAAALVCAVTTTWQRFQLTALLGTGATVPLMIIRNAADAAARSVLAWGAQAEAGTAWAGNTASSYIRTTSAHVTRATDVLTYAVGAYPAALLTGLEVDAAPDYLPADAHAAGQGRSIFGIPGTHTLLLSYNTVPDPARLFTDNASKVGGAFSWAARGQMMTFGMRPPVGQIIVSGATVGSGTATVAAWTIAAGDLQVGAPSNFFGRLSRYVRVL